MVSGLGTNFWEHALVPNSHICQRLNTPSDDGLAACTCTNWAAVKAHRWLTWFIRGRQMRSLVSVTRWVVLLKRASPFSTDAPLIAGHSRINTLDHTTLPLVHRRSTWTAYLHVLKSKGSQAKVKQGGILQRDNLCGQRLKGSKNPYLLPWRYQP